MFFLPILGFLFVWLAVAGAIYTGLWHAFLRRTGPIGTSLFNIASAVILSPGAVGGHGVAPFPGGLAFLLGSHGPGDKGALTFNFAMWMLTTFVFFMLGRRFKARQGFRTSV